MVVGANYNINNEYTNMNKINSDIKVWGPLYWYILHHMAYKYNHENREHYIRPAVPIKCINGYLQAGYPIVLS